MLLPTTVDRTTLRTFWVLLSLGVGALTALILPLLGVSGVPGNLGGAAAVGASVALPGLARPAIAWPAYRAWNWLARRIAAPAIRYVTMVCFFTAVLVLSRSTSPRRFERSSTGPSMWKARDTLSPEMYASLYHDTDAVPAGSWTRPLSSWMRSSGHPRAWALLPFLWLIRALGTDQRTDGAATSGHNYTLY